MTDWNPRANDIFLQAVQIDDAAARREFIDRACEQDSDLREEVERLLAAYLRAGQFLRSRDVDSAEASPTPESPDIFPPGTVLAGRYVIGKRLGEGGMGVVFLAEQVRPVKRPVAVKLMKEGHDLWQIAARFDQERNALALMDHPNIAKIYDAGVVDVTTGEEMVAESVKDTALLRRGLPYFAMEYIQGVPITEYCDRQRLTPASRIDLFIPVCEAVQHAHQKGIIHRDLKPSNVLVEVLDDRAIAKVIDFGVAKATGPPLTEESLHTAIGSIVGTLEYMSPEQARFSHDIDTRTDVYALGVVLYELLAGTVPHSRHELQRAGLEEMLRIIKEVDPLAPSSKLSSSESLPSIASDRATIPSHLIRAMRGDLDWVVLKALDKDRNRRYDSVTGLADDLRRCLTEEPVTARPPSITYRCYKAYRRNRMAFRAAAIGLLLLIFGTIGTTIGFVRASHNAERAEKEARRATAAERATRDALTEAEQQRDEAQTQRDIATSVKNFLRRDLLQQADITTQANSVRQQTPGPDVAAKLDRNPTIRDLVDRAVRQLTEANIEQALPEQPIVQAELLVTIGFVYRSLGEYEQAERLFRRARAIYQQHLEPTHPSTINCTAHLAEICKHLGRYDEMRMLAEEEFASSRQAFGPSAEVTLLAMRRLSDAHARLGDTKMALDLLKEAVLLADENPEVSRQTTNRLRHMLATNYMRGGQLDAALDEIQTVHEERIADLGESHPDTVMTTSLLGSILLRRNEPSRAVPITETVVQYLVAQRGADHPETITARRNLAYALRKSERYAEAAKVYEQVLPLQKKRYGDESTDVLVTMADLGECYEAAERHQEAIAILREALRTGRRIEDVLVRINALAQALQQVGQIEAAEEECRQLLQRLQEDPSIGHRPRIAVLSALSRNLLQQAEFVEAENYLRELIAVYEQHMPDRWTAYRAQSLLGESLLEQQKYADAESLLRSGYEGMVQRQNQMTPGNVVNLADAASRLVRLYELTENEEQRALWQSKLDLLAPE